MTDKIKPERAWAVVSDDGRYTAASFCDFSRTGIFPEDRIVRGVFRTAEDDEAREKRIGELEKALKELRTWVSLPPFFEGDEEERLCAALEIARGVK